MVRPGADDHGLHLPGDRSQVRVAPVTLDLLGLRVDREHLEAPAPAAVGTPRWRRAPSGFGKHRSPRCACWPGTPPRPASWSPSATSSAPGRERAGPRHPGSTPGESPSRSLTITPAAHAGKWLWSPHRTSGRGSGTLTVAGSDCPRPLPETVIYHPSRASAAARHPRGPERRGSTVDTANSARSWFSPNQVTISMPPITFRGAERVRHRGGGTTLDADADQRCRSDTAGSARPEGPAPTMQRSAHDPPPAPRVRSGRRSPGRGEGPHPRPCFVDGDRWTTWISLTSSSGVHGG